MDEALVQHPEYHARVDPTLAFPEFSLDDTTIVAWRWQPRFAWPLPQRQQHDYCALLRVIPSITQHTTQ